MTREQSLAKLAEIAKEESNFYEFIAYLSEGDSIIISKKKSQTQWTVGSRIIDTIKNDILESIKGLNEKRDAIRTSLAMGITDDEVGGEE